jgi:hypothetical protein
MLLFVALTLLGSTPQATPEQPDFSGRWVLDTRAAVVGPDTVRRLVVLQPITRTNVRGEPIGPGFLRISIRREADSGNSEETRLIGVEGGTASGLNRDGQRVGDSRRMATQWQDNSLVLSNLTYGPDGPRTGYWTERREEWSLEPDGRLRVEISIERWESGRRATVFLYRRDSAQ